MPPITRWAIRIAMGYLLTGMVAGALYWINAQWVIWKPLAALSPTYLHMLVVGWLTQLVFGVIYWMFPIISKTNMRGDPRLAWAVIVFLNAGLILRVIFEPLRMTSPDALNGNALVVASILQTIAGYLFVIVCWPRVRERAGK